MNTLPSLNKDYNRDAKIKAVEGKGTSSSRVYISETFH